MMKINQDISGFKSFVANLQDEFKRRVGDAFQAQLETGSRELVISRLL